MEDPLAPFADLFEDDTDAVHARPLPSHAGSGQDGPFSLPELSDYGRLFEYSSGLEDFSAWDGVFETKPPESPEPVLRHVADQTEPPKLVPTDDDFAHVSASKNRFQFSEPADMDSELRSEMLELLNLFQAVYEKKPAIDKASLLRKCVAMCERIMDRFQRLPQVVAMHEQAQALLQALETGSPPAAASSSSESSGSSREQLRADVKEALDRVDREAEECEDPNEGKVVDGVYILKGIRYCKTHVVREQCEDCGVDYRLLNQVHREEDQVDTTVIKEQQRLEELELQRNSATPRSVPETTAPDDDEDAEDFQSIAKDLNEELARAREKDEADFLKCFASFQIS